MWTCYWQGRLHSYEQYKFIVNESVYHLKHSQQGQHRGHFCFMEFGFKLCQKENELHGEMWRCPLFSSFFLFRRSRSRFRSGRFGGGRAAGEPVLDCHSCPLYHLDGLIVLQSQLSSLEHCVDPHSKKPRMQLQLWHIKSSGDNSMLITLPLSSFILLVTHSYNMCGGQFTCIHTQKQN